METKERYGRFVLQFEDARTSAGSFYRAVLLGPSGYEKHAHLFRSELLAQDAQQAVVDGLRSGLAVQHAQVARGYEAGRVDKTAFAVYELFEGRSVGALMERSQSEGHPFAADHALLIASKTAAALEAAQTKKQTHGFLMPEFVHVSHDGEVSVRGFGLPPRVLRSANCVGQREARFLAPEVEGEGALDIRADIFSLGAQLFEMITGVALPRTEPTLKSIDAARILTPGGDGTPIPKALAALLIQSLAEDPGRRFKDAAAFRKSVDTLLFSGDYSPTTFNLAFFMHTLFRDEGDDDAARIKAEKSADYRPYLRAEPPPSDDRTEIRPPAPLVSPSGIVHSSTPAPAVPARPPEIRREPARGDTGRSVRPPTPASPALPDTPVFATVLAEKQGFPVVPVVFGVIAVLGIAGYLLFRSGPSPAQRPVAAPTMNDAERAALARVRELESQLAKLEAEKAAAEQKATEEATQKIEAQAKARGRAVDPLELQRAQDDARRKAQAEQDARVAAERQKIDEERRRAEAAPVPVVAAATTPSPLPFTAAPPPIPGPTPISTPNPTPIPLPTPNPTPTPSVAVTSPAASAPLDLSDPNVVAPQLVSQVRLEYPPVARVHRVTGSVVISALVDEQGNVVEARVIRGAAPNSGLNEAALENVKRRKYKPATLNGKPGRAWIAVQVDFKL